MKNIKKENQYWKERKVKIFFYGCKKWLFIAMTLISMTNLLYAMDLGGFEVEVGVGNKEEFVFDDCMDEGEEVYIQPEIETIQEEEPGIIPEEETKNLPEESEVISEEEMENLLEESEVIPEEEMENLLEESEVIPEEEAENLSEEPEVIPEEKAENLPGEPEVIQEEEAENLPEESEVIPEEKAEKPPEESEVIPEEKVKEPKEDVKEDRTTDEEKDAQKIEREILKECLYWKNNIGKEKEVILNTKTEGTVFVVSFRINGKECEWKWDGKKIVGTRKNDLSKGIVEVLIMHEKGKEVEIFKGK